MLLNNLWHTFNSDYVPPHAHTRALTQSTHVKAQLIECLTRTLYTRTFSCLSPVTGSHARHAKA